LLSEKPLVEIAGCGVSGERFISEPLSWRILVVLLEALFAHVMFFKFPFAQNLGNMDRGRTGASFAFLHGRIPRAIV
jgi:hypothetical protein